MAFEVCQKIFRIYGHYWFSCLVLLFLQLYFVVNLLWGQLGFDYELLRLIFEGQVGRVSASSHKIRDWRLFSV
jgi:hypothetical protein